MSKLIAGSKEHWGKAPKDAVAWAMDVDGGACWWRSSVGRCNYFLHDCPDTTGASYDGNWWESLMLRPTEEHEIGRMVSEIDSHVRRRRFASLKKVIKEEHADLFPPPPKWRTATQDDQGKVCQFSDDADFSDLDAIYTGKLAAVLGENFSHRFIPDRKTNVSYISAYCFARIPEGGE